MRVHHPDRIGPASREVIQAAEETAKLLNHAYECVLKELKVKPPPRRTQSTRQAPPTVPQLISRSRASIDHAAGMVDRWRRSVDVESTILIA